MSYYCYGQSPHNVNETASSTLSDCGNGHEMVLIVIFCGVVIVIIVVVVFVVQDGDARLDFQLVFVSDPFGLVDGVRQLDVLALWQGHSKGGGQQCGHAKQRHGHVLAEILALETGLTGQSSQRYNRKLKITLFNQDNKRKSVPTRHVVVVCITRTHGTGVP